MRWILDSTAVAVWVGRAGTYTGGLSGRHWKQRVIVSSGTGPTIVQKQSALLQSLVKILVLVEWNNL
jgi:hypothetical protein